MNKYISYFVLFFYWYVVYNYLSKKIRLDKEYLLSLNLSYKKYGKEKGFYGKSWEELRELSKYILIKDRGLFSFRIVKENHGASGWLIAGSAPILKYVEIFDNFGVRHVFLDMQKPLKEYVRFLNGSKYFTILWRNAIELNFELTEEEYNDL